MECLTASNKPFDFDADPDHNPDPGILMEFSPAIDRASCKKFAVSDALTRLCAVRVLLVIGLSPCMLKLGVWMQRRRYSVISMQYARNVRKSVN